MGGEARAHINNLIFAGLNLAMTACACVFLRDVEKTAKVVTVLAFLMLAVLIPSVPRGMFHRLLLALSICFAATLITFVVLKSTGALRQMKDFDKLKDMILRTRQWGILVFLLLTILQVVVLPIPGGVTILIGVAIYGPFWSFILSTIGIYIGSAICFMLGRTFGKRLVSWLCGKEKTEKYANFLNEKGRGMFVLMLLFPVFPDDLLCMVAGVSSMSKRFFFISMALTRPVMTAVTAFLGSGKIIPFKGWGIPVWIGLFALSFVAFLIVARIKNRIAKKKKNA